MKKKILSLILCMFLAVGGFVFAACGDSGYDIKNFSTDFDNVAKITSYVEQDTNGFLTVKYTENITNLIGEEDTEDEGAENANPPYSYLNTIYKNLAINSQEYIIYRKGAVAGTTTRVSVDIRNELEAGLTDLKTAVSEIGQNIDELDKAIRVNASEEVYLARFKLLTDSFAKMYKAAGNISNTMSKVLGEENYNYFENKATFDANGKLLSSLKGNIKRHISITTQNYVTMSVEGVGTALPANYNIYIKEITSLNDSFDSIKDNTFTINGVGGEAYNQAIKLYNITSQLINNRNMYFKACDTIKYLESSKKTTDLTEEEKLCMNIIEGYKASLSEYTKVLNDIVSVLVGA